MSVTRRVCGTVIHALSSENGSKDVLIIFIFYTNVQGKETTGNKCQHPFFFFLALKVETHLHNDAIERKELHVVKIDIKLTPAGDGERPTCSSVEKKS